ncbi:MAG: hypothetical protein WD625_08145 [Balneolales bacterium]
MSTENIPTIHVEPVDDRKLTLTDLVEVGEQIYAEFTKNRSGESIDVPEAPEPEKPKKDMTGLVSGGILLVAGAMLTKKLLF